MATLCVGEQTIQFSRTMCPGTDAYMPPEAIEAKPVYTEKIDCFSFGVLVIQILTRLIPAPGNRQEVMDNHLGLPKGRKVMVSVPEVERRKNHIDLIDPNHPLLTIAFDCLKDTESDRPSAQQICERVAALKENSAYTKSNKGAGEEEKVEILRLLNELIRLKDQTLVDMEKEIQELKKELTGNTELKDKESIQQRTEQPSPTEKGLPVVYIIRASDCHPARMRKVIGSVIVVSTIISRCRRLSERSVLSRCHK